MAEEKKEIVEIPEFEEKSAPRSSKDLWLFLIIIDVVCLCVFGFFLYKNLSAKLLAPQEPAPIAQVIQEEVLVETPVAQTVEVVQEATPVDPVLTPAKPEPVQPTPVVEPVKPEPAAPAVTSNEKKESVSVKVNPKSKYRQVTFRYFDLANSVAVVSGFTMAKPRALTKKDGVWETTLAISPGTYKYLLVVDGKQQVDPHAPEKDGRSVLVVE